MSGVDLFCLVADRNMEAAISGLLERHPSLGIRQIRYRVAIHPRQERRSRPSDTRPCLGWSTSRVGRGTGVALEERLHSSGMRDWARAVVIEPELEAWVFSRSPHVARILGWEGSASDLREALQSNGFWAAGHNKPSDPKSATEWALHRARIPRPSSIYRNLAKSVSTTSCTDRSFVRFRSLLRGWFPSAESGLGDPGL